jgi:hypothetical protein
VQLVAAFACRVTKYTEQTAMKTSTRRRIGAILLGAAIVAAVVLQISGLGFHGLEHRSAPNMEWLGVSLHWSLFPVGAVAAVGLLCLILPPRPHRHNGGGIT